MHLLRSLRAKYFYRCLSSSQFADTIFALSSGIKIVFYSTFLTISLSGQGKCGVAVIRVSGPQSENALKKIANFSEIPKPRMALLRSIRNPVSKEILDKGLVLWFPGNPLSTFKAY